MRVLHVITSLQTGGVEKLMVDLLPRQKAMGVEADIVLFEGGRTHFYNLLEEAGIQVLTTLGEGHSVYDPRHILRLRKLLGSYDIIHTHNSSPQLFAVLAAIGRNVRLVTTEHSTYNRRRDIKLLKPIERWVYGRYDRVICVSHEVESKLREHLGATHCPPLVTIYNGIDLGSISNAGISPELREFINGSEEATVLIMVAGFRTPKDHESLIRAMALLPESYKLILVGSGGTMEAALRLVDQLDLGNRIRFLGTRTDVPSLLKASDINILSSHYEGFGLSAVEGMASGKPLIASDVDGLREVVADAGMLVEPRNPRAIADAVLRLGSDEELRKELTEKCIARSSGFDLRSMAEGYVRLYRELLGEF